MLLNVRGALGGPPEPPAPRRAQSPLSPLQREDLCSCLLVSLFCGWQSEIHSWLKKAKKKDRYIASLLIIR